MNGLILKLQQVGQLVQLGLVSGKAIVDAFKAGRVAVERDDSDAPATADEVRAAVERAQNEALATGDAAAGRIEDRHRPDVDQGGD